MNCSGDKDANEQSLKERLEHLEGLDESRRRSAQHVEAIQLRRKIAFDKRNKTRNLRPGMLVLLQDARKLDFPGKFDALWLGPFLVKGVFPNNSVQLQTLNGEDFPHPHCRKSMQGIPDLKG